MPSPLHHIASKRRTTRIAVVLTALLASLASTLAVTAPARAAGNPVTPGDFRGYAFDQCVAPTQHSMDTWLKYSPYRGVGIYISGDSRGCPVQPNLSSTWVSTQLAHGWKLFPITLGPQASCTTRARYLKQVRINPSTSGSYAAAKAQGAAEAGKTVSAASALGIVPGSTLWYDLEAFNIKSTTCRNSALSFLSGWTQRMHQLGYVSGTYSSAASGIKMLSDSARLSPGQFTLPDRIWIADWNNHADTRTSYIPDTVWSARQRMHQYKGGHNATYGGVTINIDSNWVDLGPVSRPNVAVSHCGGVRVNYPGYAWLKPGKKQPAGTKALQCLLKEHRMYSGAITGRYDAATIHAVRVFRSRNPFPMRNDWGHHTWISLLAAGDYPTLGKGATGEAVRRAQRALNASHVAHPTINGVVDNATVKALKSYQAKLKLKRTGIVDTATWRALALGRY